MSSRSDANRGSKYAPSFTSDSHLSQFYHHVNGKAHDDFHFERPTNDADIEAMFESVVRNRDLGDLSMLSIDQKWHMVYNDEHIRRNEERTREDNSRKQVESGHASIVEGSPEWYIQKFMNRTVTPKQAGALQVCLRSRELSWFQHFISIQGTSVLGQTLMHLSRKGQSRQENDILLEYEIVKNIRLILNIHVCVS
jgi:cytokinesis protein